MNKDEQQFRERVNSLSKEKLVDIITEFWVRIKSEGECNRDLQDGGLDSSYYGIIGNAQLAKANLLRNMLHHKTNQDE